MEILMDKTIISNTPTKAATAAARVFIHDMMAGREHLAYQFIDANAETRAEITNGNAYYQGARFIDLPEQPVSRLSQTFDTMRRTMETAAVEQYGIPLDASAIKEKLNLAKAQAKEDGGSYERHTARYIMPLSNGMSIGFDCERLLTDIKMLGVKDIMIRLPLKPHDPAILYGKNGRILQCPCRI